MSLSSWGSCITHGYAKLADFNVENLFVKKNEPGPPRTVYVNQDLPHDYLDSKGRVRREHVYFTNQVITSKYTIITFLPRNLLEQFRRIANVFFLGIAILQFNNKFSTISPGLVILPLLIVLTITAAKDAYEDVKRHHSDRRVNHSTVRVLAGGGWVNPNAMGRKARTFVRGIVPSGGKPKAVNGRTRTSQTAGASRERPTPCEHGITHIARRYLPSHMYPILFGDHDPNTRPHWRKTLWEDVHVGDFVKIVNNEALPADILICATTKNLDGETNLKSRHAVQALTHIRSAADCANRRNAFAVDCDRPDTNIIGKDAVPVDLQMALLRGTVLRNTEWVIGVDTKIILNSGGTPSKRSKVERQMNPQVFINLILLALMAAACAIADSVLEHQDYPRQAPWLYGDNTSGDNPSINGLVTFAFALITFQNIVPISLYISIEFVRTCQAAFIYFDKEIFYEKTQQPTLARKYIFSDKTGTLTQNSMIFQKCSIAGKVYGGEPEEERPGEDEIMVVPRVNDEIPPFLDVKEVPLSSTDLSITAVGSPPPPPPFNSINEQIVDTNEPWPNDQKTPDPVEAQGVQTSEHVLNHFRDARLSADLTEAAAIPNSGSPDPEVAARARALNGFFNVLALCHTVLASVDAATGALEYKAQSPDEAALVQAAADVGFVFRGRDRETLLLQTPFSAGQVERYELLNILEFTSARKRMSVVVRKMEGDDRRILLLCKGADNVIFERLKQNGQNELKNTTERHLQEFAAEGLRTLTLAYKVIGGTCCFFFSDRDADDHIEEEYKLWAERYNVATVAVEDREAQIEAVSDELERDLRLLGATAIEDKLQDGVPEAIADLKKAGIKIWVATGDKIETAIAIGHSTNLIGRDSNIIVIRGANESIRPVYQQMMSAAKEFFPESESTASSIVGANNGDRPGGFVLVIDGGALGRVLSDSRSKQLLLRLASECEGVICCRVSPLQKALIVRLVKDNVGAMTLAIGDGANDVSMIQAADVGVGIVGEEGLQAVNSSDYAIAQFRFLKRLLLVHGHWSYARNGNMILNFFYKNIVCIGVLWWFQIYAAWSSTYVFEYTYLIFWNSFWTFAPVIAIGLFDRIVDDKALMALPQLYQYGREGHWFGLKWFTLYMLDGVVQSVVIYFLIAYTYWTTTSRTDGWDVYLYEFSTTMVFACVIAANLFNGLNTNVWTVWVFLAVFFGIGFLLVYTAIYDTISPGWFATPIYGNNTFLFHSAYFWLCLPLTVCLALLPRYLLKAWKFGFAPDDFDIMRYIHKNHPPDATLNYLLPLKTLSRSGTVGSKIGSQKITPSDSAASLRARPSLDFRTASRTDMSTGERSFHRGFDFSTEENSIAIRRMQTNLSHSRLSRPKEALSHILSVRRGFLKKKPPPPQDEQS
ncbi:phospholipid-translocating ATPase [Amanita rubescens]|nr:phospholipid-translocating ATPase [Amanita rubescens]